jgi:hypothetical protein
MDPNKIEVIEDLIKSLDALLRSTVDEDVKHGFDISKEAGVAWKDSCLAMVKAKEYLAKGQAPKLIGITVNGGLVNDIFSNHPDLIDLNVIIIDYDIEGMINDEIIQVKQYSLDGTAFYEDAYVRTDKIQGDCIPLAPETFSPTLDLWQKEQADEE